ncbi:MAG: HD domain-containing protein [Lachnospiraceae bacterium]|nr:HD domain-containing protein [Lachnospiraceae bacterium]
MIFVKVDDLKPGMRLGKPIYNKNGVLLYDRDTKLTMQAIYGIKNFRLMGLYILEPAEPVPPMTEDDINFERFQTMAVFSIREDLDLIATGKKDKGLDWLCSLVIKNYGDLDRKINFVQSLRSSEDFVYKHVLNVAILSAIMGGHMGLSLGRINTLVKTAILHDIGALKLPELPDNEEVDTQTKEVIKKNTLEILEQYGGLDEDLLHLTEQMQELYTREEDGDIPEGLKANVNANILYVADAYDRMTAMKSQEEPTSEVKAVRRLLEEEDRYDQKVVNALIRAINILYPGVCVELTNGEKGLVIAENEDNIFEPMVLDFHDNTLYDLARSDIRETVQIADVMKTMDNRIKLDPELLEEYQ